MLNFQNIIKGLLPATAHSLWNMVLRSKYEYAK